MIRTGRPAFHIKACTISFTAPNGDIEYYELDQRGELVKSGPNKKIIPHHVVKSGIAQFGQNQFQYNSYYQVPNLLYQQNQQQNQQIPLQQLQNQQNQHQQFQYQQYPQQQDFQQLNQNFQQQQNEQPRIGIQQNEQPRIEQQQQNERLEEQHKIEDSFFDLADDAIEESSTLLFGMDPNAEYDFSFFIENEVNLI